MRRRVTFVVLVACALAGCTSGGGSTVQESTVPTMTDGQERNLPEGDEPTVLGRLGDTNAEFETEDGLVQVGSADVPDVIPDGFPMPDDVDVQLASQTGAHGGFSGITDLTFDALVDFYETELPAAGYETERSQFVDGVVAVFDFDGQEGSGQLAISSAPGGGHSLLVTFQS